MTNSPAPASETPSLLEFPCVFPIKVMGVNTDGFMAQIADLVRVHDPQFDAQTIAARESTGGKYLGLTLMVHATSREQLDDIYRSLTAHPLAKFVL